MAKHQFHERIICCYLYTITKYGYPPPARDTVRHIEEMARLGFRSIELEGIRSEHLLEVRRHLGDISRCLDDHDLRVPYFCAVLPGLSSHDSSERRANLELFRTGCEVASKLGANGILDNAPLPPYVFPESIPVVRHYEEESLRQAGFPDHLEWDRYWNDLVETYREACAIAASFELTYHMHPALGLMASSADGFLLFHAAVDSPNLRFNFDVSNLFALGENLTLAFLRLLPHIDYLHISDNRGEGIEHIAVGDGDIPWAAFAELVKEQDLHADIGIDVGGAESEVRDLDTAYIRSAEQAETLFL